jgi:HAD superfamily hydrolase (TIGR01549 family)
MIKAVFFDLSDTLCDYQTASAAAIESACEYAFGHSPALTATGLREAYLREGRHAAEESKRWTATRPAPSGGVDQHEYRLWERALEKCGVVNPILAHAVALHYQLSRMRALKLFADTLPALQALQGRTRLGLVAEGSPGIVNEELALLDIHGLFSINVIEGDLGYTKYNPQVFAHAVREAQCEPREAAHIGDSLETDVASAHGAGLITVWVSRSGDEPPPDSVVKPDHTVADLSPVPDLLLGLP